MKTCIHLMGIGVMMAAAAWAQSHRGATVRGEIFPSPAFMGGLTVELRTNGSGIAETAEVRPDGSFEFRSASTGMQELRVIGPNGAIVHREFVNIAGGPGQFLTIRVPEPPPQASRAAGGGPISIRQLDHKIPRQAQKAFDKGQQAAIKGNQQEAAKYFREAVTIDPEYVDAYNELGAAEAAMGEFQQAAEQFQKAIDLVPEHHLALPNLSIVLAKMKKFREAGEVARRALKVAPGSGRIHYILAASLIAEDGDPDEVLDHLARAADEVPKARLIAANLLAQRGQRQDAARQLEDYLKAVPAADTERPRVEAWLAQLKR